MARERETYEDALKTVPGLKDLKVSRRYARAFDRLSGPRATSSRALALALVTLVFASGFLLGRVGSMSPAGPVVRAMPAVEPLGPLEVKGSVSYATVSRDPLLTIAMHDLFSGDVTPSARFSTPFRTGDHVSTEVTSFGRSVAVVVTNSNGKGYVAFAPHNNAPQGWILGIEAAWASERELYVRHVDSTMARWSFDPDTVGSTDVGDADQLLQTAAGPIVRRGKVLETVSKPSRSIEIPSRSESRVAAVSPDTMRVLLDEKTPTLWDGKRRVPMSNGSGKVLGAAFDPSSERVAVVLDGPDGLLLAIVDEKGHAALKPLSNGDGCTGAPVWDGAGRWVYVSGGDGTLYAVEAVGGRIEAVSTQAVGCGVTWVDVA